MPQPLCVDGFEGPRERQRALSAVSVLTSALEGQCPQCHPNAPRFWSRHPYHCPDLSRASPSCLACLELSQTFQSVSPALGVFSFVSACSFLGILRSHGCISSKHSRTCPGYPGVLPVSSYPLPSSSVFAWDLPILNMPVLASLQPFPDLPQAIPGILHLPQPLPP